MAIKDFSFRGNTLEQLQKMDQKELAKLFKSRTRRKMIRGFTDTEKKLIIRAKNAKPGQFIKTHCRDMIILPDFVGKLFGIHAGKEYKSVSITAEMIGHRLGEFSSTCKPVKHSAAGIGATKGSKVQAKG